VNAGNTSTGAEYVSDGFGESIGRDDMRDLTRAPTKHAAWWATSIAIQFAVADVAYYFWFGIDDLGSAIAVTMLTFAAITWIANAVLMWRRARAW
jgi:hypothetical protein